ncbi:hypothetical protein BpHYR1_018910 [Brachionus plicatilis]|uniref:Uncharacterized protein n=1 Tax=Brachionus plicatilis TaxID=10195 RepID=A0A3M7R000_BRAPC|nr:hypothetical protein BpHYR1_018910 [Brachionus plicatilis]
MISVGFMDHSCPELFPNQKGDSSNPQPSELGIHSIRLSSWSDIINQTILVTFLFENGINRLFNVKKCILIMSLFPIYLPIDFFMRISKLPRNHVNKITLKKGTDLLNVIPEKLPNSFNLT